MSEWKLVWGDVDIHYGGMWIKDHGDYADTIELTDLDSATGTRGMVMLEFGSVGLYGRTLRDNVERLKNAFQDGVSLRGVNRENARLLAWAYMKQYGYGDNENYEVIRTDPEAPLKQDGWEATETTENLEEYLQNTYDLPLKA